MNINIDFDKLAGIFLYDEKTPMIFNSGVFVFFFLVFVAFYVRLREKDNLRIYYVVLFSCYFYYKSSGMYFLTMLFVTLWDFFLAKRMHDEQDSTKRKILLALSVAANLGMLGYFKYTNFFAEMYCGLMQRDFSRFDIFLPVGISFFVFQSMSYTIDVYRRQLRPLDRIGDYAFFISFFPMLVAGPIIRARDFIPQIRRRPFVSRDMLGKGIVLIISGLFKKAVISDYISVNFVDRIFDNPTLYSGVENLFGVYGYALQIYCDFSGYSDMAIGIATLLGFKVAANFDSPYRSATITEFWRRWHISLSSWLRDYLYISLGGNRKGKIRTYVNLMVTMLLGGLWHGPSLRFVCWGAMHGIALAVHKLMLAVFPGTAASGEGMSTVRRIFGTLFTFHLVCFSWIFFRAQEFGAALDMIRQIFTSFHPEVFSAMIAGYPTVFAAMLVGYLLHFAPRRLETRFSEVSVRLPAAIQIAALTAVIVFVMQIKSSEILAFIYFQF